MFDVATVRIRGPLSGLVAGLAEHLAGRGYRDNTVRFLAEVFARLSRWLQDEGSGLDDLDWVVVDGFLDWSHARGHRSPVSRRGMAPLVEFLIAGGVVPADRFAEAAPVPGSPEDVAGRFIGYLVEARGVASSSTVKLYHPMALAFLRSVSVPGRVDWDRVGTESIQGFLTGWSASRSASAAGTMASVLRALLRFAFVEGWTVHDLAGRVGKVGPRRGVRLVEGLSTDGVERLIGSIEVTTRIGARDRAIVVMLSRLGLRAGEAARLRLDDIDWQAGVVTLRDPKSRHDVAVPLPVDVGAAVVTYLRLRRAPEGQRAVFLREHAPVGPMTTAGISGMVADRAAAAGLGLVHAHRLRHAAAMAVIARGGTLVEAGQLLGHARAATTLVYARADGESLRGLAIEWPEARP
ncbi:MAG TPA: tyrosine-type recombinase/integrase [Micropruina sp.]|nr:tyrosine-type recombinase/integrase [Micropruina sp.]HMR23389.1 tyrosine-type recombinase/integrase [Micropruina sp.]